LRKPLRVRNYELGMRTIEYRRWSPPASRLRVEFPADLLLELGWAETSGVLYGSRQGADIRIAALQMPRGEAQQKVGVFVSRIRGEVFLTETDLAFLKEHKSEFALVVAGDRAGFFVREQDGSIQTVRSHEEFAVALPHPAAVAAPAKKRRVHRTRLWMPALVALAALPIAGLAVAGRIGQQLSAASALTLSGSGGQLRISWKPGRNAVLVIDDSGRRRSLLVYPNQSSVTYVPRGSEVEVSLVTVDAASQPRRESALYLSSAVKR
jgi:hypothetical protein